MRKKFYTVSIRNVKNDWVLGRISGMLDISANLSDDRHGCGWSLMQDDDCDWRTTIFTRKYRLKKVLEEARKWYPCVKFDFWEYGAEES